MLLTVAVCYYAVASSALYYILFLSLRSLSPYPPIYKSYNIDLMPAIQAVTI